MYYLGYLSFESFPFTESVITNILIKSRANNARLYITGILMYINGCVVQIIEGDKNAVNQLFQIILEDNRHTGVTKIIEGYHEKRSFPDWSMGYKALTGSISLRYLENMVDFSKKDIKDFILKESNNEEIFMILKSFYMGDDSESA